MADFGSLDQYLDDVDVQFSFKGEEYKLTFPFARVAAFKAHQAEYEKRLADGEVDQVERRAAAYTAVAILLGAKFDPEKWEFRGLPKDHFINQLIKAGAGYTLIDRVVSAIWAKYQWNDDIAVSFVKTYDLGKALAQVMRGDNNTAPATQPERGETTEADSETNED